MQVPLLDVKRQNAPLRGELLEAFLRVLDSGQYILGREAEALEESVAAIAGTKHGIGVSSGTDAILLALMAVGVGPGDEVICPSFTFFATAGCIARTGARPVFADVCPECFNMAPGTFEHLITPRTKAIVPVHLFGQAAHMDEIMAVARAHGLAVIEDAAQALGAGYHGRPAGAIGDFGAFSFYPSKNLGGFGEAGMLVTNDDKFAERARLLRSHGASHKYFHRMVGGNFRIDPVQAALLSVKVPRLPGYTAKRAANACVYTTRLVNAAGVAAGPGCADLRHRAVYVLLPGVHEGLQHIWNQYTVRVVAGDAWRGPESPRDALKNYLEARRIGSEIYYPRPMHQQECFAYAGPHPALPVSERLAAESLSIPVFPELTAPEQDAVTGAITEFLEAGGTVP